MKRYVSLVAGLAMAVPTLGLAASVTDDNCRAERPDIEVPGSGSAENAIPDSTRESLSKRLATCGSVLDPPPVGDPDLVEPAPRIGDPMNIHPEAPDRIRP